MITNAMRRFSRKKWEKRTFGWFQTNQKLRCSSAATLLLNYVCCIHNFLQPGLVTNSILFCWLGKIKDRCKKCVFNKGTIKVCVSCCWWCPGTCPSMTHLTMFLYLCSSGSNTWGELMVLEGRCVSLKSPFGLGAWKRAFWADKAPF